VTKNSAGVWSNAGLFVGAVLFAIFLCEVVVRLLGLAPQIQRLRVDQQDSVYERSDNPRLGYVLKRNYRSDSPGFHSNYAYTNADGLRDVERTHDKPAGVHRIVVLGDSVVLGHGLPSVHDTISRQLETLLASHSAEALNLGVGGYCTRAEVELLEVKGLAYEPDVVVLVFVENDWDDVNGHVAWVGPQADRPGWAESLFVWSELYRLMSYRLDWYGFRTGVGPNQRLVANMNAIGDSNVEQGLSRLKTLSDAHGFRVLIALWPRFTESGIVEAERGETKADDVALGVERLAQEAGFATVRLSQHFRADYASRVAEKRIVPGATPLAVYAQRDGMHPSKEGASVAAQALQKALTSRDWLAP